MQLLKKGQLGYGLMIEQDAGFISPSDNTHFLREMKENVKGSGFDLKIPKVYAVMQKYGVENRNGRIYPEELLRREVEAYLKLIEMGASAGQTDHPSDSTIAIKETSMRVTNLWWDGRNLMGEIFLPITRGYIEMGIISHPADKVAHDMLNGFRYGVSSRGVGSLETKKGKNIVQDDFELICWDFVTTPSTIGSWVFSDKEKTSQFKESVDSKGFQEDKQEEEKDPWGILQGKKSKNVERINNIFNNFLSKS